MLSLALYRGLGMFDILPSLLRITGKGEPSVCILASIRTTDDHKQSFKHRNDEFLLIECIRATSINTHTNRRRLLRNCMPACHQFSSCFKSFLCRDITKHVLSGNEKSQLENLSHKRNSDSVSQFPQRGLAYGIYGNHQ